VYHPALVYLLAMFGGAFAVWVGGFIERRLRVDDVVGAVAVHGACGFLGMLYVGIFASGYPTGVGNGGLGVESSLLGQLVGMATFFPLAFIPGYVASWLLKRANLLRVPPEVELEGMDIAEFQQDFYPEFEHQPEVIVLPDGTTVESGPVLVDSFRETKT
jgi:ammonia channel protein AmtB